MRCVLSFDPSLLTACHSKPNWQFHRNEETGNHQTWRLRILTGTVDKSDQTRKTPFTSIYAVIQLASDKPVEQQGQTCSHNPCPSSCDLFVNLMSNACSPARKRLPGSNRPPRPGKVFANVIAFLLFSPSVLQSFVALERRGSPRSAVDVDVFAVNSS